MFNIPGQENNLGLSIAFLSNFLETTEISSLTGLDVNKMNELYEFLSNGERSRNMAKIAELMAANEAAERRNEAAERRNEAAERRAEAAELFAEKEAAERKALAAELKAAEQRIKITQIVLKLSRIYTNSSDIALLTGLSVEEVEQILSDFL
ncbi:MAG: hypothetical protein LBI10_01245 [Deltaproteobacteria bacterium]|jgi:hypothetical protein|nr:hypothetical protein [Deltaproteobacteria bacterium]